MRVYWASRHELTEGQLRMLNETFSVDDEVPQIVHERVTFSSANGLTEYIRRRLDGVVVCVAGAVHYLYAMSVRCEFYIFERDINRNFSSLYKVYRSVDEDAMDTMKVEKVSGEPGFFIDSKKEQRNDS